MRGNFYNMNSHRLQARYKFNNKLNQLCKGLSDNYVNFIFDLYSELDNHVLAEDSVFLLACKEFSDYIHKSSLTYCDKLIEEFFIKRETSVRLEDFCDELIYDIFKFYCEAILDSYKTISYSFLGNKTQEILDRFSSTETFHELRFLDFNYLKSSIHRFRSLNVKLCEQNDYMYSMFQDEYMPSIVYNLKDYIVPVFLEVFKLLSDKLNNLSLDNSYVVTLLEVIEDDYDFVCKKYLNYKDEVDEEVIEVCVSETSKQSARIDYIDDYKRLNKIATDNGYSLVRSNGDHGIFRNLDGNVVVIPQGRTVGKGLSMRIQKVILNVV